LATKICFINEVIYAIALALMHPLLNWSRLRIGEQVLQAWDRLGWSLLSSKDVSALDSQLMIALRSPPNDEKPP